MSRCADTLAKTPRLAAWMRVGGVTTAVAEGGYLLPARQGPGLAQNPLAQAVKDNRIDSQEAAGGDACCGWQCVAEAGFLPSRPAGAFDGAPGPVRGKPQPAARKGRAASPGIARKISVFCEKVDKRLIFIRSFYLRVGPSYFCWSIN